MRREAKLLLSVVLFGAVLSVGASTSSAGHSQQSGVASRGLTPSGVQSCQFTTNDVFDTKWNTDASTSTPLGVSQLNYPWSNNGGTDHELHGVRLRTRRLLRARQQQRKLHVRA